MCTVCSQFGINLKHSLPDDVGRGLGPLAGLGLVAKDDLLDEALLGRGEFDALVRDADLPVWNYSPWLDTVTLGGPAVDELLTPSPSNEQQSATSDAWTPWQDSSDAAVGRVWFDSFDGGGRDYIF